MQRCERAASLLRRWGQSQSSRSTSCRRSGISACQGLFADEIEEITEAFEAVFATPDNYRMDMNEPLHRNDRRVIIPMFIDHHPTLASCEDERILGSPGPSSATARSTQKRREPGLLPQ